MKYAGTVATEYGLQFATASSLHAATKQSLALRHARAMAAVLRAAKVWTKARNSGDGELERLADIKLRAATARPVAVEKEVERA